MCSFADGSYRCRRQVRKLSFKLNIVTHWASDAGSGSSTLSNNADGDDDNNSSLCVFSNYKYRAGGYGF